MTEPRSCWHSQQNQIQVHWRSWDWWMRATPLIVTHSQFKVSVMHYLINHQDNISIHCAGRPAEAFIRTTINQSINQWYHSRTLTVTTDSGSLRVNSSSRWVKSKLSFVSLVHTNSWIGNTGTSRPAGGLGSHVDWTAPHELTVRQSSVHVSLFIHRFTFISWQRGG